MTTTRTLAPLSATRASAEAAFEAHATDTNLRALQAAGKAEMDAYLAEAEARAATPRKALHTTTPTAPIVYRKPSARAKAAMLFDMTPAEPTIIDRTPERNAAYLQYISDGLADTDGYYAPLTFDAWAAITYRITLLPPTPVTNTLPPKRSPGTMNRRNGNPNGVVNRRNKGF